MRDLSTPRRRLAASAATLAMAGVLFAGSCEDDPLDVNEPPEVTITAPTDGATFVVGEQISLEGSADDPEDGALTGASLLWESDLAGDLGTGATVAGVSLAEGTHEITLTATDGDGATASASIEITVEAAVNQSPSAEITLPEDGATFTVGEEIEFDGAADDPEDGELTGDALVWESDLDGEIGTGATFTSTELTEGDHTITLTATDGDGATDVVTVEITVEP